MLTPEALHISRATPTVDWRIGLASADCNGATRAAARKAALHGTEDTPAESKTVSARHHTHASTLERVTHRA